MIGEYSLAAIIWPSVFLGQGEIKGRDHRALLADGLMAWALVMAGNKAPDSFGVVLCAIGKEIGLEVGATADNLSAFGYQKGWLKPRMHESFDDVRVFSEELERWES